MEIIKTIKLKPKPSGAAAFGTVFTDHMFVAEYSDGKWINARIRPYQPFVVDPATSVLHYGQAVFEGMKAYKNAEGEIRLFRPDKNLARLNISADRICMPQIPGELFYEGLNGLLRLERDWIPVEPGTALYIRPVMIAVDPCLAVHACKNYIFYIILSPVGSYYSGGLSPVKLLVEEKYSRSAPGGTGGCKFAGNYAASLKASASAEKQGYDQVMWLDSVRHEFVEEVGSMNICFVINGEVITPALTGSILPGITRMSVIEMLTAEGYKVAERAISIAEVIEAHASGALTECFGTGTAAVVSPVGSFGYKGAEYVVGKEMGEITAHIYDTLTRIQTGELPDPYGWVRVI